MNIQPLEIPGSWLISGAAITDERGWFMRTFDAGLLAAAGLDHTALVQANQSRSRRGTIRGLHTRSELREAKLVRVARGSVQDVIVDLRPASPTFLQWRSYVLDDEEFSQLWVPAGCAHGFQALSALVDVCYQVDAVYAPEHDVAISWNDPDLRISWPIADPIISARDRAAPPLRDLRPRFGQWFGQWKP